MSESAIRAYQGKPFTITLRKNGGTDYLWCLTKMPEGVALASVQNEITALWPGAPVDQVFTFLALKDGGLVDIAFKLLSWSKPEEEAEEVAFKVNIIPHNAESGLDGFIKYSENSASYIPPADYSVNVEKYGFPGCVKYGYAGCDNWPPIVAYGYPNCVKYGYPGCDSSVTLKYGYAGCDEMSPIVDYGYPGCVKYGYPCYKYGYPGCI